ncbi:MAG: hypothetical protein QM759_02315 [Terricaulis sp.]
MSVLADFRALVEAPGGPETPEALAEALAAATRAHCNAAGLQSANIEPWGPTVTMLFSRTSAWEAVAFGPDDFQFYPGQTKADGTIQWPSVWTADYFSLASLIDAIAAKIDEAARRLVTEGAGS